MDYKNVSFFVESCQLLFENKLSWIFYEQIYFHDTKENYFLDNWYIIIKLIIVFICYPGANWQSAHGWANLVKVGPTLLARDRAN